MARGPAFPVESGDGMISGELASALTPVLWKTRRG